MKKIYEMLEPFLVKLWIIMTNEDVYCINSIPAYSGITPSTDQRENVYSLKRSIIKIIIYFISVTNSHSSPNRKQKSSRKYKLLYSTFSNMQRTKNVLANTSFLMFVFTKLTHLGCPQTLVNSCPLHGFLGRKLCVPFHIALCAPPFKT